MLVIKLKTLGNFLQTFRNVSKITCYDDGDQVTIKILWTQEANVECDHIMNSKSFFISPSGQNTRSIKFECMQTMYDMTKDPDTKSRRILESEKKELIEKDPKDFTFAYLVELFGDRNVKGKRIKSRFNCNDTIQLNVNEYYNSEPIITTVGRLVWNKIMIDRVGTRKWFKYNNGILTKKEYMKYENAVTLLLREDVISPQLFRTYIDHRDWLGLQLHGIITVSYTEKTIDTPKDVKILRDELFKKYKKELDDGDVVIANKIEKELIGKMVSDIKDDPGFDLYASGARGDINNHMKNIFIMRGAVMNPNTGKYEIMQTSFNDGLRKEDFTPASNSVVQGAFPKACGTADSGYLAKQLMAGMQTEVLDGPGSDCGTETTLDILLVPGTENDYTHRFINDNGTKVYLTSDNIKKYSGKKIHLYSPMCCRRTSKGYICEKCGGKQDSKFVGLDTNKIATTLTNLNMKKFHDSTLRFKTIDIEDILVNHSRKGLFNITKDDVILNDTFEIYIPIDFFEDGLAEDLGNMVNLFGLVPVGIFEKDKFSHFDTLNIPMWHKYNVFESDTKDINIPGLGMTKCKVLRYLKGHQLCGAMLLEDSSNAQMFLRQITYGKVPTTIPYNRVLTVWQKNQRLNAVNFGVPSITQEVVLSCCYRYKKDPSKKFAEIYGKDPHTNLFDYEMAGIRRICQVTSTFTGITFESFDDTVTMSLNRSRDHKKETDSPLEVLFKL